MMVGSARHRALVLGADFSTAATNAIAAFTEQYATIDAATGQIAQIAEQDVEPITPAPASRRRPSAEEEDDSWPDGGVKWESF